LADSTATAVADTAELRSCLNDCAATRALVHGIATPIAGGLSNQAWCVATGDQRWFVRLGHPQAARLGVDRWSECALLQAVSAAGLAPAVRACEPATGLLVMRYIDGAAWCVADAQVAGNIGRVAECMRLLHGLPVPAAVREVDHERQAARLAASLPPSDPVAAALAGRAAAAFGRIRDRRTAATLCHNDLHHLNLVDDGTRLWLVDWEYGGLGDPLFDVAGFLALHDLGTAATDAFVDAYGRLSPSDCRHLDDARWLFDYVQWLWYRSRFPDPVGDQGLHAERLAQRLLRCNN
jgi:thiamine kinase